MNTDVADIFPVIDWNTVFDLANIGITNNGVVVRAAKSTHAFNCPPNGRFAAIKVWCSANPQIETFEHTLTYIEKESTYRGINNLSASFSTSLMAKGNCFYFSHKTDKQICA
jgi:hypothetical protein